MSKLLAFGTALFVVVVVAMILSFVLRLALFAAMLTPALILGGIVYICLRVKPWHLVNNREKERK